MKRVLALTLAVTLGHAAVSFAAEPLAVPSPALSQTAPRRSGTASGEARFASFAEMARVGVAAGNDGLLAQSGGSISSSGLKKRTKLLLYVGVAAAVVGAAYGIDHSVKDFTPSTLGTREDKNR